MQHINSGCTEPECNNEVTYGILYRSLRHKLLSFITRDLNPSAKPSFPLWRHAFYLLPTTLSSNYLNPLLSVCRLFQQTAFMDFVCRTYSDYVPKEHWWIDCCYGDAVSLRYEPNFLILFFLKRLMLSTNADEDYLLWSHSLYIEIRLQCISHLIYSSCGWGGGHSARTSRKCFWVVALTTQSARELPSLIKVHEVTDAFRAVYASGYLRS
jgi:hypothetical protein